MGRLKELKLLGIGDVINTEDSRINYLRGLIRIAECDNNKTTIEKEYINKIAEILGASYSEIWKAGGGCSGDESLGIHFDTRQEKVLFLMQALYLCWVDSNYSDIEREEIIAIGEELGLESSEVTKIESWVNHGIDWMRAGADLLRLE